MNNFNRGLKGVEQHKDWLQLVESEGPFLSLPVLNRIWPNGVDRFESHDPRIVTLKDSFEAWRKKPAGQHENWIKTVLHDVAGWKDHAVYGTDVPAGLTVDFLEHRESVSPWAALYKNLDKYSQQKPLIIVHTYPPDTMLNSVSTDGWAASPIDRMSLCLRRLEIPLGLVTDGRWWAIVWAENNSNTGYGIFDSLTWIEERLARDAFFSLVSLKRQIGVKEDERLNKLFQDSLLEQEVITEALGIQVRQAVELLIQALSEIKVKNIQDKNDELFPDDEHEVYQGALTVMMRIVFLLFAEERGLLPLDQELYGNNYSISNLLNELESKAMNGEEYLENTFSTWYRLLSTSSIIFNGASFDDLRMPAYGGSLFDPTRFTWLLSTEKNGALSIQINDRVMLHILSSIQKINQNSQIRKISFREMDVEQIGYIYEGLLGFTSKYTTNDSIIGLIGKKGNEPEILSEDLFAIKNKSKNEEDFFEKLNEYFSENQPTAEFVSITIFKKMLKESFDPAIAKNKLSLVTNHDKQITENLLPFFNLIRSDLRTLPFVVPKGGIFVTETRSRKNAGAHYTPRSLAEEVVENALLPLVYSPGPFDTEDKSQWKLIDSNKLLDLKIIDIAAGSGAFLVAAARFLSQKLYECWENEGILKNVQSREIKNYQIETFREVISKCLYGVDINEMAVEMCKLSLWLVSLDINKPFTFLDSKIMCGNSLLGITDIKQLENKHIYPKESTNIVESLFDLDIREIVNESKILRNKINESTVDDNFPQRSMKNKKDLFTKSRFVSEKLRLHADAIIAAGLKAEGKPGNLLENEIFLANHLYREAFLEAKVDKEALKKLNSFIFERLTPTVETDYKIWQPFHWPIEFPEVFEMGGFNAIIGNPPFLVSKTISGALGLNFRNLISNLIAGKSGKADLIAFFFLRASQLIKQEGIFGLVGAQAIREGATGEVGLAALVQMDFQIYSAWSNRKWPVKSANTNICLVWITKTQRELFCTLDGIKVDEITYMLSDNSQKLERGFRLTRSHEVFQGTNFYGEGFIVNVDIFNEVKIKSPKELEVFKKLVNGSDLNSTIDDIPTRYIVDFKDFTMEKAKEYVTAFKIVESKVKPFRLNLDSKKYPKAVKEWWKFWNPRQELYAACEKVCDVVALSAVSTFMTPIVVETGPVFSSAVVVWPYQDRALFALLSSWHHRSWSQWWGSGMQERFRYVTSDCYETFPFPKRNEKLNDLGEKLDLMQKKLKIKRQIGMTNLYKLFHNPLIVEKEINELRYLHKDIDRELHSLYGFDFEMGDYEFSEFKNLVQYGPNKDDRIRILQALLAENKRQHEGEVIKWPL
jgi:hypothetical protein